MRFFVRIASLSALSTAVLACTVETKSTGPTAYAGTGSSTPRAARTSRRSRTWTAPSPRRAPRWAPTPSASRRPTARTAASGPASCRHSRRARRGQHRAGDQPRADEGCPPRAPPRQVRGDGQALDRQHPQRAREGRCRPRSGAGCERRFAVRPHARLRHRARVLRPGPRARSPTRSGTSRRSSTAAR